MPVLDDPRVVECFRSAGRVYTAIGTRRGPHVTPELFTIFRGRLWFATARRTLKARVTGRRPSVGLLAAGDRWTVVARGEAHPLDVLDPRNARPLRSLPDFVVSPLAAVSFTARNAGHLAGFVAQGPAHWPRSPGELRILVAVRLVATAMLEDGRVVHVSGDWGPSAAAGGGRHGRPDGDPGDERTWAVPPDTPADVAAFPDRTGQAAVLGWDSADGPLALPARWDPDAGAAFVPAALLNVTGARAESTACLTFDRMDGFAMDGKRGIMLRGDARLEPGWPDARIDLEPDAATWWAGQTTETAPTEAIAPERAHPA